MYPVPEDMLSDYAVYVRHPVDLSTIKYRLDGSLPSVAQMSELVNKGARRYETVMELVVDLKRVFQNAIKYNKVHLETDNTGLSVKIYEAAQVLQTRLESLLVSYASHCIRVED